MPRRDVFTTIHSEGALLPPDFLQNLVAPKATVDGLAPADYHLAGTEKLNEAASRAWNHLVGVWAAFHSASAELKAGERATTVTREKWLLPLFQELGYGRLQAARAFEIDGKTYAISHVWGQTPIHLVGRDIDLDRRTPGVAGASRTSPHGLLQEFLNRSPGHLWGVVSNGLKLRLLRDNRSFTRQAYVEFDLAAMMDGQGFADFVVLWLVCHQSRVEGERPELCWLEKWSEAAKKGGTRALDDLRDGVQRAIEALGRGFLKHAANGALRGKLASGALTKQDYYRQLLREVYRLIFVFVAEDRELLLLPDATAAAKDRYNKFYSVTRLRSLAERRRGTQHDDLWRGLSMVFMKLSSPTGCLELGIPALGSFLWSDKATPDLDACAIANADLLGAVRALAFTAERGIRRAVDYRNLGPEELGSVYESLLELHPELNAEAGTFELRSAAGHERKATGSYYTPTSLIESLLDSALDPILDDATKNPDAESAILKLTVCDPACGSGHFLLAAAHRIAKRLAAIRTGEEEPAPGTVRTALRDVIGHCVYGVDVNPMAVELCKVSLWLEALNPGKPLSFLDHRIRVGNSLIGASPELIGNGVPDAAFNVIEGDDRNACAVLKRRNAAERRGLGPLFAEQEREIQERLRRAAAAIDDLPDEHPEHIRAKELAFAQYEQAPELRHKALLADVWCAAFFLQKNSADASRAASHPGVTQAVLNNIAHDLPLSSALAPEIDRLASSWRFFHWHLTFPEVFAKGGFDLVLGNPPWDTLSPDRREYFGQFQDGMRSLSPTDQDQVIDRLLENSVVASEWTDYQRRLFRLVHFLKHSGRFTLFARGNLGKGDFNVYRMFTETALKSARQGGCVALVLPGGIYGGANASAIRQFLMDKYQLLHLWGLSNTERGWFSDVDMSRFAAFAARRGGRTSTFLAQFGLMHPADLAREPVSIDADFLRHNAPDTYAIPDVRSAADLTVAAKMVNRYPPFGQTSNGPPIRHYQAELHMGNDRHRFTTDTTGLPLYEGRMIGQFDHRAKTYDSGHGNSSVWIERPFGDPLKAIVSQWTVRPEDVPAKLGDRCTRYRLCFRDVAQPRDVRSLIATLVPPGVICGDKVPTLDFGWEHEWAYLPWLAVANSFVMDWMVRSKLSSPKMSFTLVDSLPFPRPKLEDTWVRRAAPLVLALVCTAPEMTVYWNSMSGLDLSVRVPDGTVPPTALTDESARALARAEIDAIVGRDVFGLTRQELSDVLETFPIVKRQDEIVHGEYCTKRRILACYDGQLGTVLAQSDQRSGQPELGLSGALRNT